MVSKRLPSQFYCLPLFFSAIISQIVCWHHFFYFFFVCFSLKPDSFLGLICWEEVQICINASKNALRHWERKRGEHEHRSRVGKRWLIFLFSTRACLCWVEIFEVCACETRALGLEYFLFQHFVQWLISLGILCN